MIRPVILISDESAGRAQAAQWDLVDEGMRVTSPIKNPQGLYAAAAEFVDTDLHQEIAAWNKQIEERKAAKRRAKGPK